MTKYLFIAQSDCSEKTREAEFIEWIDNIHVPDILNAAGIIGAARYENINPEGTKRPKNMIVYEIEIDDINKFYTALDRISKEIEEAGRVVDMIVPEKAYPFKVPPVYKQVMVYKVLPKKFTPAQFVAKYMFIAQFDCSDKTREGEFIEWMDNVHVPEILKAPGIVRAARYINIDPEGTKRPEYINILEIKTDDISRFLTAFKKINKERESGGTIIDTIVPEKVYPFSAPIYKQTVVYRVPPKKHPTAPR